MNKRVSIESTIDFCLANSLALGRPIRARDALANKPAGACTEILRSDARSAVGARGASALGVGLMKNCNVLESAGRYHRSGQSQESV
jgi:hypothetical protein